MSDCRTRRVTTIIVYKLTNLSREEIEAMLEPILEEPPAIREWKEEARQEGRSLIMRQLNRRFGVIPDVLLSQIQVLSLEQLELNLHLMFHLP